MFASDHRFRVSAETPRFVSVVVLTLETDEKPLGDARIRT
jgi:hypothetical protein